MTAIRGIASLSAMVFSIIGMDWGKMKKLLVSTLSAALVFGVSGCTSGTASAEPYGGQCGLIAAPLVQSSMAMVIPGSGNFADMDALQQKVWEAGYESIADWANQVESAHDYLMLVDTSLMSSEEAANIEYLRTAISTVGVTTAVVVGDVEWFTKTTDVLITVGAACD
jgi:hypothetical protein